MDGNQVNIFDLGLAEEEIDDLFKCFYDYDFANASINDSDETCTSASVKEVPAESSEMSMPMKEKRGRKRRRDSEESPAVSTAVVVDFPVSEDVNLAPRPKPLRPWRRVNPIPRILKRDIRRDIPIMITNVYNSNDTELVRKFFMTYSVGSCHMNSYAEKEVSSELIRRLNGLDKILAVIFVYMLASPDNVVQLHEAQIKQHLDREGSQLIMTGRIQGTRIKDFAVEILDEDQKVHRVPLRVWDHLLTTGEKPNALMQNAGFSSDLSGLNVSITPYKIDFFVDMTYWLDNDHRIYRMDMKSVAFEEFEADKLFQ
eukprot:scaffold537_cov180-Ochromonas_danica.AAC.50